MKTVSLIVLMMLVPALGGCSVQQPEPGMAYPRWPSVYRVLIVNNTERMISVLDVDQDARALAHIGPGQTFPYQVPKSALWEGRPTIVMLAFPAEDGGAPDIRTYTVYFRANERVIPLVIGGETQNPFRGDRESFGGGGYGR